MAAGTVYPAAVINRAAGQLRCPLGIVHLHRRAARGPLVVLDLNTFHARGAVGRLQPTLLRGIAVDCVFADQVKYQIGATADHLVQTLAPLRPQFRDGIVGIVLGVGWNDLAIVAA